ncbi:MAG: methionyl-tRNA formyltransferase [Alphaproteobacteria bacterium]
MMVKLRVVFMGTPDFSVPVLEAVARKYDVVCVYSQPPRPAGRGQKLMKSPVHQKAEELGIMVRCPLSLKSVEEQQLLSNLKADISVVAAYGMILPEAVISIFSYGCINVHASLLPRWRGASPIQSSIMAGDKKSGISIMKIVKALDAGDVLLQKEVVITKEETAETLHDKLSCAGANAIIEGLSLIAEGNAVFKPQDESLVTYATKINKEDAKIDFSQDASIIEQKIRAYNPAPGAWFLLDGNRIKINLAEVIEYNGEKPFGTIIDNKMTIACGKNALSILKLQKAGKSVMKIDDFLRGLKEMPSRVD